MSIILPTYNRKHCIKRALDSVLNQTYKDFELILVDDGSTDGTEEYISSMQEPRIRYIYNEENVGTSEARNIGIRAANGEYIAFQDSDTVWKDNKLEKQVAYMDGLESEVGMIYSPYKRIYSDFSIIYPSLDVPIEEKSGHILPFLLEHPLADTPTMLIRKNVLTRLDGFDSSMKALVDYELSIRIASEYEVGIIDEVLVLSYNEKDSISNNYERHIENAFFLLRKHKKLFEQYDMVISYLNQLSQYALRYNCVEIYLKYMQESF